MKFSDYKKEALKDEEVKREYDALAVGYELISQIIDARIENHLTQKQLAELAGTNQSRISRLEKGSLNPSLDFIKKIATALGKEVHITFKDKQHVEAWVLLQDICGGRPRLQRFCDHIRQFLLLASSSVPSLPRKGARRGLWYCSIRSWRGILLPQIVDTGVTRLHYCVVSMLPLYQHVNRYPHILHSVSLRITYSHTKSKNFLFAVFSCLFSHKPMWR